MELVFANFSTDAPRWPRVREKFASAGLEVTDKLDERVRADAKFVLNKTRYVDADWLAQFRSLAAVVVLGREDWMVDADVPTLTLDVDRGYEVAEHAVALLLAGLKRLHRLKSWRYRFAPRSVYGWFLSRRAGESIGAHNWTRIETRTLHGASIGIVGYGQIGRQIHRRLAGFDARVFYHHPRPYANHVEERLGIRHLSLDRMFATCDAVFVQTPLGESTRGLVSREVLASCRRGMLLVNCGRAAVIEQAALAEALADGRVGFYGADVFWREPMPLLTRFRFSKKCLITPHMAESLPERRFDLFDRSIHVIQQFQGASIHAAA
jgi:lactate dehydrogenase-like 2-hydroxyacid dehydrogenase